MSINVINKDNGKNCKVYDITYDKTGYPHFLIYNDGHWIRMSAKHFRPYNEKDLMKTMEEWSKTGTLTFPY